MPSAELVRDALASYLDDLDTAFGPTATQLVDDYDVLWP